MVNKRKMSQAGLPRKEAEVDSWDRQHLRGGGEQARAEGGAASGCGPEVDSNAFCADIPAPHHEAPSHRNSNRSTTQRINRAAASTGLIPLSGTGSSIT